MQVMKVHVASKKYCVGRLSIFFCHVATFISCMNHKKKSFDCLNNSNLNEQKNLIFNYNSVFFSVFVIKGNNHDDNHNYI